VNQPRGFGPALLSSNQKGKHMAIDRANKPYDPSENKPGTTFNSQVGPTYLGNIEPPPKPGISGGLLAWVLTCAAITIILAVALVFIWK
jgi:hypothetical protein